MIYLGDAHLATEQIAGTPRSLCGAFEVDVFTRVDPLVICGFGELEERAPERNCLATDQDDAALVRERLELSQHTLDFLSAERGLFGHQLAEGSGCSQINPSCGSQRGEDFVLAL